MKLLIQNARVLDPKSGLDAVSDILIEDGAVREIGKGLRAPGAEAYDAGGLIAAPGLVDMHCHLREPGQEYKEDIESGTKSAAAGGFTSVACMPNTDPVTDSASVVAYIKNRAAQAGHTRVYPIAAISKGMKGGELAPMGELKDAGAVAVSDDGKPVVDSALMRHALEYAQTFALPVISHCEVPELGEGAMNEGYTSTVLGLRGINRAAEEIMVSRDIILAGSTGTRVHIAHVSTRGSVALVRRAKADGVSVTCETCPHYFSLTDEAVTGYNANAKMTPPLRTADDVEAIIEGLADGTIDAIATDHAPHHEDEKTGCEFDRALNGIVGFETALSLGLTYLVETGRLSLSQLLYRMSAAPAGILNLPAGELKAGAAADIVLFDPERERIVSAAALHSKSKNTPYDGARLKGEVISTLLGGRFVVKDGRVL